MSALSLLVFIIVIAFLLWVTQYIPDATGQKIARVAIIVFSVIWFVARLGLLGHLESVRIP